MKKFLVLTFILMSIITAFLTVPANAAIKITPNRFEFTLKPNSTKNIINGSFSVQGGSNEIIRFRVYPENFNIAKDGSVITDTENAANDPFLQNIRFNPLEFTLTPGQPMRVRFTIPNIQELSDGEHRIALLMEDVKTREQALPTDNENVSASIVIKTRVGVPIYINKGKTIKSGSIEKFNVENTSDGYYYVCNIKSTGNSNIRITNGKGQISCGRKLISEFPVDGLVIQAGNTGNFKDNLPIKELLPNEEYKFKITFIYKDQNQKDRYLINEVRFKNQVKNEGRNWKKTL